MRLTKLAKQYQAEPKTEDHSMIPDAALLGTGGLLASMAPSRLLGYKNAYHGTNKENAANIKREGLRADLGGTGASKNIGYDRYVKNSTGYVHGTIATPVARMYANFADLDRDGIKNMIRNPFQTMLFNRNPNGEIIRMHMDYDKFKRTVPDLDSGGGPLVFKTNENITPEEIVGSRAAFGDRLRHRASKFPGYLKNHPGRFGLGVGLGAGGLGLAYLGGKGLYDTIKQDSSQ